MNNFTKYWSLIVIVLPLFVIPEQTVMLRHVRNLFFISSCFGSLILFSKNLSHKRLTFIFFVISTLSFFNQHSHKSPDLTIKWVCLNLGMIVILQMTTNLQKSISYALGIVCITQSIWILLECFGINLFGLLSNFDHTYAWSADSVEIYQIFDLRLLLANYELPYANGSLNNLMLSGALIAITAPFLFNKLFIIFLPLAIYCVFKTESTMSILSLAAGAMTYFIIRSKSKLRYFICAQVLTIPLLIYLIYPEHQFFSFSGRIAAWQRMINFIKYPDIFIGKGVGYLAHTYKNSFETSHLPFFSYAHSEPIEIYVAFGILGLALCTYLLISMLGFKKDAVIWASFIAFLVNASANFPMHISPIALVGIICFALIWRKNDIKRSKEEST